MSITKIRKSHRLTIFIVVIPLFMSSVRRTLYSLSIYNSFLRIPKAL